MAHAEPQDLQERLGYHFRDMRLCTLALTHSSFAHEHGDYQVKHNERLEFLGDAVISLCVAHLLMERLPATREGQLTKLRAEVVSERTLALVGRDVELGSFILLGRGERRSGGHDKASILADTIEALVGAVFLDGGFAQAEALVERLLGPTVAKIVENDQSMDFKSRLQELTQAQFQQLPQYLLEEEQGPDHDKLFVMAVLLDGQVIGRASGPNKKAAERRAAREAYQALLKTP